MLSHKLAHLLPVSSSTKRKRPSLAEEVKWFAQNGSIVIVKGKVMFPTWPWVCEILLSRQWPVPQSAQTRDTLPLSTPLCSPPLVGGLTVSCSSILAVSFLLQLFCSWGCNCPSNNLNPHACNFPINSTASQGLRLTQPTEVHDSCDHCQFSLALLSQEKSQSACKCHVATTLWCVRGSEPLSCMFLP